MTDRQHHELMKQLARVSGSLREIRECLDPIADLAEALLKNVDKMMEDPNEK